MPRVVLFVLTVAALLGVFFIIRPFLAPLILALLLVSIFHPAHKRLRLWLGKYESLAAMLSVTIVFLLVVVPVALFSAAIVKQGVDVFRQGQAWIKAGNLERALEGPRIKRFLEQDRVQRAREFLENRLATGEGTFDITATLVTASGKVLDVTKNRLIPIVTGTGMLVLNFAVMLFVMFYAFRDGEKTLAYLLEMMPLAGSHEATVIARIRSIARAILLGSFMTAATQGVAGMIGFTIVGIPALFWGVMMGVASLVPLVGTALVWLPAAAYLYITGKTGSAVFLVIWGAVVVGSIDNFLRPFFMKGQSGMSTIVLFFAILGGIRLFGPIGIVYGPLIFGFCAVILYIYRVENLRTLQQLEQQ